MWIIMEEACVVLKCWYVEETHSVHVPQSITQNIMAPGPALFP